MVGGQETTTNLIGNGLLTLLRHPEQLERLRDEPALMPSAVEELLRYESPSQHTARLAPEDASLGGKQIPKGAAVIAVMGAGNRDPERFPDPDRLDLDREDNRHLAFGWAAHFCFGAPLARMEGQIAFETLLAQIPGAVAGGGEEIRWRPNLGLRGLTELHVSRREPGRPPATAAPLSVAQEALWYASRLSPNRISYNETISIRKDGPLDVGPPPRVQRDRATPRGLADHVRHARRGAGPGGATAGELRATGARPLAP